MVMHFAVIAITLALKLKGLPLPLQSSSNVIEHEMYPTYPNHLVRLELNLVFLLSSQLLLCVSLPLVHG